VFADKHGLTMSVSSANTLLLNDLVDGVFRNSAKVTAQFYPFVLSLAHLVSKLNPKELKKWKDFAVKTTKSTQFARVNQFEVDATLLGLIEKFQVLNRDDLAQGLDEKLKQLSAISSKWTPEVLALLLHLSDQPSKKTNVYSPQERPSTPQQEPLTWNQILSEDPVSDEDLWLQESYSPISSDSEDEIPLSPKLQPIAPLTPIEGPELSQDFGKILIESNDDFLQDLTETQFWRKALVDKQGSSTDNEALISVPELHVIREAIIMLRGVPTSLFHIDQNGVVHFIEKYTLNEITQSLFSSVMQKLATIGTRIGAIRSWADKPQSDHSMQRFQAIICNRLTNFYKLLSDLEILYTDTSREKVVSLLELGDMLSKFARPLIQLEIVITHLTGANTSPFLHLELLYDLTCMHQASGDDTLYEYMAKIFFDALTIYLRTIRHWMQQGKLETNDSTFFIARTQGNSDDSSIWHDQYYLLKSSNAALHAPKFTHPAAGRILNAGKTVIFLERLGVKAPEYIIDDDDLKFDNLSGQDWNTNLAPFATLFEKSFNAWIQTKYSPASSILRQQLTTTYALERNLAALQEIYFSSDGSMFQSFADPIFEAIDRRASSWNDKFLLSGRLQELYRTSSTVEVERLSIRTTSSRASTRSVKALSTIIIDYNVSYFVLGSDRYNLMLSKAFLATSQCHSKI
jgi:gamma-tubulin complex component 5